MATQDVGPRSTLYDSGAEISQQSVSVCYRARKVSFIAQHSYAAELKNP